MPWARNFAAVSTGSPFWYVNANGLVELAANRARVCDVLDIEIGTPVRFLV
ncbi:SAM hydroxide adenosyltransferase [Acidihalobacter prosperus]